MPEGVSSKGCRALHGVKHSLSWLGEGSQGLVGE